MPRFLAEAKRLEKQIGFSKEVLYGCNITDGLQSEVAVSRMNPGTYLSFAETQVLIPSFL